MSDLKLNQVVALEKGVKSRTHQELTETYHALQKPALLAGITRKYTPRNDDDDKLPDESTRVQVTVDDMLSRASEVLTSLFDITATKDWTNCVARADVRVDGTLLMSDVPVSYLLFLEKQLVDLHTVVKKLPVLDPSEHWTYNESANCYASDPVSTVKTKKVPRNHVKAEATDKHPAQVEVFTEDVIVGNWTTVKFSGALPQRRQTELLRRVEKLQAAVKVAREQANMQAATEKKVGAEVFNYLFGK